MKPDSSPLSGVRVLNTRPASSNQTLSQEIHALGGLSIELPALCIVPKTQRLENPSERAINLAIFISPNAVDCYFKQFNEQHLTWPDSIEVIALGRATANCLARWNIRTDHMPETADSEHLLQLSVLKNPRNQTILLIKGEGGRPEIAVTLKNRGANLIALALYQRQCPEYAPSDLNALWHNDAVDIILFTSQQAIHNVFSLFGTDAHPWICKKPCLVISERLRQAAKRFGINRVVMSRYDEILNSLCHYYQGILHGNQK